MCHNINTLFQYPHYLGVYMGQYFVVANLDKKETFNPHAVGDGVKAVELVSGATGSMLAYLLLQGPQDGTSFSSINAEPEEVTREKMEEYNLPDFYFEDDFDDEQIARSIESYREIEEANEFAGRWAGDRITIVGDYDDSGLNDELEEDEWTDISERVKEEAEVLLGEDWFDEREEVLRPDMVLKSS